MRAVFVALAALALVAPPALGRDLFVAPSGDDANPGTMKQPFATLPAVTAVAQPGDTINFRAGDYPRRTYWDEGADGTPKAHITVRAYDGPRTARLASLTLHGKQYVDIVGLDIDGRGGGNAFHVDGHANHVTIRDSYAHDAGFDGDCIKINQCTYITIEGNEIARPGRREDLVTYQEGIDFVDVDFSAMRNNYLHDFGDMALYSKGGSKDTIIEGNVISHQLSDDLNPAAGFGQETDLPLMRGAAYQSYNCVYRNNIIRDCPGGAIGTYDCFHGYFYNNLVHNCGGQDKGHGVVHLRTSTTWLHGDTEEGKSDGVYFFNNIFLDTRGAMPMIYQQRSGHLSDFRSGNNCYYNAGKPVPSEGFVDPNKEKGAVFADPGLSNPDGTADTRQGWIECYRLTARSRALIDRGANAGKGPQPAVTTDITGTKRPQGKGWDIGPFEWKPGR